MMSARSHQFGQSNCQTALASDLKLPEGEIPMESMEIDNPERRRFLRALPAAAAAGLTFADLPLSAAPAAAAQGAATAGQPFTVIPGRELKDNIDEIEASRGANSRSVYKGETLSIVLTNELATMPEDELFEWNERRDHIIQILAGRTTYQLGGKPQNPRSIGSGEWRAQWSEGATSVELKSGDLLIVPRGTPHKRITRGRVAFELISPM